MNNNISVSGNLGRDPELRFNPEGLAICNLSVALTPRYKNGTVWEDKETIWFKATFFGAKAEEIVDTYAKGNRVKLTGQLQIGQPWVGKDGSKHDGDWEIGNAEIELDPWKAKGKVESGALAPTLAVQEPSDDSPPF